MICGRDNDNKVIGARERSVHVPGRHRAQAASRAGGRPPAQR